MPPPTTDLPAFPWSLRLGSQQQVNRLFPDIHQLINENVLHLHNKIVFSHKNRKYDRYI